jgi:sterol desaturase/sphingolipid hydroxylase (fatty acid hydroxylase superfamily)
MLSALADRLQGNGFLFAVVCFLALAAIETIRPAQAGSLPLGARWVANIGLYVANASFTSLFWVGGVLWGVFAIDPFATRGVAAWCARHGGEGAVLALGFVTSELFLYWAHRVEHAVGPLWRMHVVHHSDADLDASTGLRHFPGETMLQLLAGTAAYILLGVPVWAGVLYGFVSTAVGLVQHANLRLLGPRADRVLRTVFVTPGMHRIHHAIDAAEHDSNFGNILSVWDRAFGTYRALSPEAEARLRFGIAGLDGADAARPHRVALQPLSRGALRLKAG